MASIKQAHASPATLTVTNLHSLASSQDWTAGWESNTIDNSSNLYSTYLISGTFTVTSSNNQAGQIRVYVVPATTGSTYPSPFDGTESTETISDTEMRDSIGKLAAVIEVDAGAGDVYPLAPFSVAALFGGWCPQRFILFVTQNASTTTTAGLAAAGTALYAEGVYLTVA